MDETPLIAVLDPLEDEDILVGLERADVDCLGDDLEWDIVDVIVDSDSFCPVL